MKKCVFVLEDNEDLRELFTYLLEEASFEVHTYPTAKAFSESLANILPDMIILDVRLPDGNGIDICGALKRNARTSNIPVMIISAHAHISDAKGEFGADEFVSKPFDIADFIDKVERHTF